MIAKGCAAWYLVAQFFTGLTFIAIAHVLALCDTWISLRRKD
jgi:hypothetical protein